MAVNAKAADRLNGGTGCTVVPHHECQKAIAMHASMATGKPKFDSSPFSKVRYLMSVTGAMRKSRRHAVVSPVAHRVVSLLCKNT